ncbi:hypothetical protein C8J57DRAFT_1511700 [Mycena rebaudengoi]|nr:hypothetical protein C8J57DRAFT_1511700 [Mycena rebaudengoi]
MTKDWFLGRCFPIWKVARLLAVFGHSFRIGGSTELLLAGVPCDIVATLGGWTSLAFLLYWRKIEHIVPMNVGKAYDKNKLDEPIRSSTFTSSIAKLHNTFTVPNTYMCPSLSSCVGKPARASGASPTGELRPGVDELATRLRRALPSLRGLSSHPEPSASRSRLPPRGGAQRDFPSRVS